MKYASSAAAIAAFITLAVLFRGGGVREVETSRVRTSSILTAMDSSAIAAQTRRAGGAAPVEHVRALIVPHHVPPAGQLIANALAAARTRKPRTVVLLGPDHPDRGSTLFTTTTSTWSGAGKTYAINQDVVRALQALNTVSVNDSLITEEHSVLIPLPYLAQRFPDAQFILITVRSPFNFTELEAMARVLHQALGPNDFVIASVDFSHYKSLQEAQQDDEESVVLLKAMDPARLKNLPADSPGSIAIAMLFARLRGGTNIQILERSNSALLLGDLGLRSTTSYVTAAMY